MLGRLRTRLADRTRRRIEEQRGREAEEIIDIMFGPPEARRRWLPWMVLATLAYLLVEVSFNARLLDVAGGLATSEEIETIERFGRLISGAALALAVWGWLVLPRLARSSANALGYVTALTLSGAACVSGAYYGEKALIDGIVDRSGAEERRVAAMVSLLSHGVRHGHVQLDGLDVGKEGLQSPEGKAFVALFPMLAYSTEDLERKATEVRDRLLRQAIVSRIGSREGLYNRAFVPSVAALEASYNRYADAVNGLRDEIARIPARADKAWKDYLAALRKRGVSDPANITSDRMRRQVVAQVRANGVPVPDHWQPYDRIAFQRAVGEGVRTSAMRRFERAVERQLGDGASLPLDLTWARFVQHPAVQERWRRDIGAPKSARLRPDMGVQAFGKAVYEPMIAQAVAREARRYDAKTETFADGGRNEEFGRAAMRAMVVPPIALSISLLGAMVHIFKLTNMVVSFGASSRAKRLRRATAVGAIVAGMTAAPLAIPNAVTQSRIYGYFEKQTAENLGLPVAVAMSWVVQMQPFAYPVNEFVRQTVLMGYGFGYDRSR